MTKDNEFRAPFNGVLGTATAKLDPDRPVVIIGYDKTGNIYVAASHSTMITEDLLEDGQYEIERLRQDN